MRRFRTWIEDLAGGAIAEVEALATRRPPTEAVRWAPGEGHEAGGASVDLVLDRSQSLTIRHPVRAGARFYLDPIGRSIVETRWPFADQPPVWTATLERREGGWDIVVHMLRQDLFELIRQDAAGLASPRRTLWLNGGAGPRMKIATGAARWLGAGWIRIVMTGALCAIALGGPLTEAAIGLRAKADIMVLADRASALAAPVRAALQAQRAAERVEEALGKAASKPGLSALLFDLASPLPAQARLTSVVIKPGEIRLVGSAPSATAVLAAYADAQGLSDVRFDGAVNSAPSGGERFSIIAGWSDKVAVTE